jgi:alpha-beta hydrolase superfamily lysophospholipase
MKHGHRALAYRFYDGGRHEIFNEAEKDIVQHDIRNWIASILDRRRVSVSASAG